MHGWIYIRSSLQVSTIYLCAKLFYFLKCYGFILNCLPYDSNFAIYRMMELK
jgi:hypothetical protein